MFYIFTLYHLIFLQYIATYSIQREVLALQCTNYYYIWTLVFFVIACVSVWTSVWMWVVRHKCKLADILECAGVETSTTTTKSVQRCRDLSSKKNRPVHLVSFGRKHPQPVWMRVYMLELVPFVSKKLNEPLQLTAAPLHNIQIGRTSPYSKATQPPVCSVGDHFSVHQQCRG